MVIPSLQVDLPSPVLRASLSSLGVHLGYDEFEKWTRGKTGRQMWEQSNRGDWLAWLVVKLRMQKRRELEVVVRSVRPCLVVECDDVRRSVLRDVLAEVMADRITTKGNDLMLRIGEAYPIGKTNNTFHAVQQSILYLMERCPVEASEAVMRAAKAFQEFNQTGNVYLAKCANLVRSLYTADEVISAIRQKV